MNNILPANTKILRSTHYKLGLASSCKMLLTIFLLLTSSAIFAAAEPTIGLLLVAKPGMEDPRFKDTVILVNQHARGQTIGVIINKPSEIKISALLPTSDTLTGFAEMLYHGGPVAQQQLVFIVQTERTTPQNALRVFDNIFLSSDQKTLNEILHHPSPLQGLRVFSGYSMWAPGQLQAEISNGDWFMTQADKQLIFEEAPDKIWPLLMKRLQLTPPKKRQPNNYL